MTTTISRLYNNYTDAQRAVSDLEAAGVRHSNISIVANNSDNWFSTAKKVDRDHDGVDDRAEGAGTGAGVGAGLGGAAGLLAWRFPVSALSSQQVGLQLPQWAPPLVRQTPVRGAETARPLQLKLTN
jgi:hypothetical protein